MILRMKDQVKKEFYEHATQSLLKQLNTMGLGSDEKRNAIFYTKLFRETFKYDEIKKYMFVTKESKIWDLGYDSAGFCRIASATFSLVMGVKDWELRCVDANQWHGNASHHYLRHIPSGQFFDLTYDQFAVEGLSVPYEIGTQAAYQLAHSDIMKFTDILNIDVVGILKGAHKRS